MCGTQTPEETYKEWATRQIKEIKAARQKRSDMLEMFKYDSETQAIMRRTLVDMDRLLQVLERENELEVQGKDYYGNIKFACPNCGAKNMEDRLEIKDIHYCWSCGHRIKVWWIQ